jgi:hypothetical protein
MLLQEIADNLRRRRRSSAFTSIYKNRLWSGSESASGEGSGLRFTKSIRNTLPKLLADLQVQTLLDAPCGDFCWMKEVPLKLKQYFGIDIVRPLIENNASLYGNSERQFLLCDLVNDELPRTDLILCRHLLIHLTFEEGLRVLRNFQRTGARYLLISDQPQVATNNKILRTGSFRPLNLRLPPFSLPAPAEYLDDSSDGDGSAILALYSLQELTLDLQS